MPNWAESEMSVVLPTKYADKFENLFLEESSELNKEKVCEPLADYLDDDESLEEGAEM